MNYNTLKKYHQLYIVGGYGYGVFFFLIFTYSPLPFNFS